MNRPTGVTVLAILAFLGTALLCLLAVGSFLGGAFIGTILGSAAQHSGSGMAGAGLGAAIGAAIGVVFLIMAGLDAVCGYGLWNLKEWGRMLTIVLSAIGVVFAGFSLLGSMLHFHIIAIFFTLVRIGIGVLVIWYLSQPQVKAVFSTPQLSPAH
jgi:hypothetical protein